MFSNISVTGLWLFLRFSHWISVSQSVIRATEHLSWQVKNKLFVWICISGWITSRAFLGWDPRSMKLLIQCAFVCGPLKSATSVTVDSPFSFALSATAPWPLFAVCPAHFFWPGEAGKKQKIHTTPTKAVRPLVSIIQPMIKLDFMNAAVTCMNLLLWSIAAVWRISWLYSMSFLKAVM